MAALAAKIYGAVPVLIDIEEGRLETARKLGIANTINGIREDAVTAIKKLTDGRMSETVMEASGSIRGIADSLHYASYLGRIAFTGLAGI